MASGDRERAIWERLKSRMAAWCETWSEKVTETAVSEEVLQRRRSGGQFSNQEVFEGLVLAILSNQTDWSRIKKLRGQELSGAFDGFEIEQYAKRTDAEIENLNSWFKERKAGSRTRLNDLRRLRETAQKLIAHHGGWIDSYFSDCIAESGAQPAKAVFEIGGASKWKLPGYGPALSAEALRNIGYDLAKPDTHILRAVRQWELVNFNSASQPRAEELRQAMEAIDRFAAAIQVRCTYADSVIWTACSLRGPHLSDAELKQIAEVAVT
jgi:endonuclease III